jgi:predicted DNA-binding transcriptional regulator AlpA
MTTTSTLIQNVSPEEFTETLRAIIKEELSLIGSKGKTLIYGQQDPLLSIEQLLDYLPEHPARQTAYGWVNDRKIPFEKYGKRLYFRKSAIDKWLDNGRQILSHA